ncbi:hypothetical protein ACNKHV_21270 [Shigella flexneri]
MMMIYHSGGILLFFTLILPGDYRHSGGARQRACSDQICRGMVNYQMPNPLEY